MRVATTSNRFRRGLGLIELMISLVIVAVLLIATATAFDASIRAYSINQEQASLMQNSRIAMNRILTTIRTTRLHSPDDSTLATTFAGGATVTGNGIAMNDDATDNDLVFRYDSANKRLLVCVTPPGGITKQHVLLQGVDAFNVTMEPMRSATSVKTGGAWDLMRRATVLITVRTTSQTAGVGESTGQQTITLSASSAPRRNTW